MTARLSVSWSAYQKNICNGFSFLQQRGEFVDMTLAADGHHVQVHKMVLCLVSPYIKELVAATQCAHPVIFLNNVSSATLEHILEYAYTGEALIPRDKIKEFLQACKALHIKGLENTSTVELHRESEQSMCQDTITGETVQEEIVIEQPCDDEAQESHDDTYYNDQEMETVYEEDVITTPSQAQQVIQAPASMSEPKKTPAISHDAPLQYTITHQGNLQIILNRYMYSFRYHRMKTDEMVWRCVEFKKLCPAVVVTKDGKILQRLKAHNHPFADKAILKRLQQGLVYSAFSEAQSHANIGKTKQQSKHMENE